MSWPHPPAFNGEETNAAWVRNTKHTQKTAMCHPPRMCHEALEVQQGVLVLGHVWAWLLVQPGSMPPEPEEKHPLHHTPADHQRQRTTSGHVQCPDDEPYKQADGCSCCECSCSTPDQQDVEGEGGRMWLVCGAVQHSCSHKRESTRLPMVRTR